MDELIASFNRRQVMGGLARLVLGVGAYVLAFLFFYICAGLLLKSLRLEDSKLYQLGFGLLGILVLTVTGFRRAWHGQGYLGVNEAMEGLPRTDPIFYPERKFVGMSFGLTQFFLAGPLQLCQAVAQFRSRLPLDPALSRRLTELLEFARGHGSWHSIEEYRGSEEDVGYLVRMHLVEFSPRTGRLRAVREGDVKDTDGN